MRVGAKRFLLYAVGLLSLPYLFSSCTPTKPPSRCEPGDPGADAIKKAGRQRDGSVILLNGRRVQPAGITVTTGTFPLNATISPLGIVAVINSGGADETLPGRASAFGITGVTSSWQSVDFVDPV